MAPGPAFEGKVVVVTGAAGGIGAALCRRFARAGARVAALDRDAAGAEALAGELAGAGATAAAFACDVADAASCEGALRAVILRFGGVDVLVNNAGITHRSLFAETELPVYRRVMDVNFFGALHCTKAALGSLLERRGLVVVTSSVAGFAPLLGRSGYCASKHALHGLFETLRCELAPSGVGVLLVCPGFTATGIERSALGGRGAPASHPQSRVGGQASPEDVAEAVVRAARARQRLLVLTPVGRASRLLSRLWPAAYERVMSRALRSELAAVPGPSR
jgi:NAD(P)-dependent dehydrogenase (short-subunit alcohol dehydrogenase family)